MPPIQGSPDSRAQSTARDSLKLATKPTCRIGSMRLFEEVCMVQMGLSLRQVTADVVSIAGLQMQLKADGMCDVGRL